VDSDIPWWGGVSADESTDCWRIGFEENEGAYQEGGSLHLSNGLILPLASDFSVAAAIGPAPSDPFPVRHNDTLCLNEHGQVERATIWLGGY
jgi:hypothetical protein